jgi:peptide/nickel transport system substrate-binding protein
MWGRAGDIKPFAYDPEQAKKLLAEAGYPNGFETEIWYMPVSRPYFPAPQPIAETIATYLADVGIKAKLKTEDWGTYLSDYDQGKFPMYMLGWSPDYPDPDNYLYTFFGPTSIKTNLGCETDACQKIAGLIQKARVSPTLDERKKLYAEAQRLVHEYVLSIPVAHNNPLHATRKNVKNYIPSPLGSEDLYMVEVK